MKKVIIIGASSGIGRGLAILYCTRGWQVGVTGRRKELLNSLQQQFSKNIFVRCFDITSLNNVQIVEELVDEMGGVDIFIFCAGIGEISLLPDWVIDEKVIATNVTACARCCGEMFKYFVNKGSGQIVIISSIAALRGGSSAPSYNASKAFVSNYAESLNLQAIVLQKDIVITDVKLGFVDTAMAKGDGKFWVAKVDKACEQIFRAIQQRRRKVVVSKRWRIVAFVLKLLPDFIFIFLIKRIAAKRQQ